MIYLANLLAFVTISTATSRQSFDSPVTADTLRVAGLDQPVEIVKDAWGISHIYAETEHDLFFAQGYNAARDRLFQLEIWRRQATGTVAEILGPREVERDIGTRLFQFRGNLAQELDQYHSRGRSIVQAFVDGINAYVDRARQDTALLPVEFDLLGIRPGLWTPDVVISRHQGLLGNIGQELAYGRAVGLAGPEAVKELAYFHPGDPAIALDSALEAERLFDGILARYNAFRRPIRFRPEDIASDRRNDAEAFEALARAEARAVSSQDWRDVGSNNWVVSGEKTLSGSTIMANDPHRAQSAPSLRYWVHLVGPGWNVIGAGEPEIPGVSIGHNEFGAWGLTVFRTDGEDLYVYETNPSNPLEYRYRDRWEAMTVIRDTIRVEGASPVFVDLKYTRHGPVVFEDPEHDRAYAVRAAWMEVGGAPYLASLRMDQARDWEEFREACSYSHIPGENMVWADIHGTIGWQAVGIAPIRPNWSGLVPVPGDGRYEWDGYLPIKAKPHIVNPVDGFFATANNNLIPRDYPYRDAVGWNWADPFRWARIVEVLAGGVRLSLMDMMELQTDELSIPARMLVPLLRDLDLGAAPPDPRLEAATAALLGWNHDLDRGSAAAALYVAWERQLAHSVRALVTPPAIREVMPNLPMKRVIDFLIAPTGAFGSNPVRGRDSVLLAGLQWAVDDLTRRLGPDLTAWRYGGPEYKHALIRHPLSAAVDAATRQLLDVGPAPRGGYAHTVNSTGSGDNQTSGASFRIIVDTSDWDLAVGSNTPGQGGDPSDPHYRDLFELWAVDRYFPIAFSRRRVDAVAEHTRWLVPR